MTKNRLPKIGNKPVSSEEMQKYIQDFCGKYAFFDYLSLGKSILGKEIPLIRIGSGESAVLYVGAHHGSEHITAALLLKFIDDFGKNTLAKKQPYKINLDYLRTVRTIFIVPMLNPDGVDLAINGLSADNILRDRLIKMNGGEDFTHWQANARGVDLNHNYDSGFGAYKQIEAERGISDGAPTRYSGQYAESEPESAALAGFLRQTNIKMILTLHTQGQEIYYTAGDRELLHSRAVGRKISAMTGYKLAKPEGLAAYGGLTDYAVEKLGVPSYTIECGIGKNPLPMSDFCGIYVRIRELLFNAPTLL